MIGLEEINLQFMNTLRPPFDTEALTMELREARARKGLTIRQVADACGVSPTEAEHWFRTDIYNAPPSTMIWDKVKHLLGIEGWDVVGVSYQIPNEFEMACRAYHERGIAPTVTVRNSTWVAIGGSNE